MCVCFIALVFVFDYHPCSVTLASKYFTNQPTNGNVRLIPETTLWSYITQIASALKAIHGSGLAARNIDPGKILVTGENRYKITK